MNEKQSGGEPVGRDRWVPSADVVAEMTGDHMVLIHMQTNKIFELNRTGARVWELLGEGEDQAGIVRRMLDQYDVDGDVLEREVEDVIRQLTREKLVVKDG